MLHYKAQSCLRLVIFLVTMTAFVYLLSDLYLHGLVKGRQHPTELNHSSASSTATNDGQPMDGMGIYQRQITVPDDEMISVKKASNGRVGKEGNRIIKIDERTTNEQQRREDKATKEDKANAVVVDGHPSGNPASGTDTGIRGRDFGDRIWTGLMAEMRAEGRQSSKGIRAPPDCERVLSNDSLYISRRLAVNGRLHYMADPKRLRMDCPSIWERNGGFTVPSKKDGNNDGNGTAVHFPVAFARNVFKDYRFLEMELLANYSPWHWYCYAMDSKASPAFKRRLRALAKCLPNVVVSRKEFPMGSKGHFTSNAHLECARELSTPQRKWHYLVTLQNHDLQLKSNLEMGDILSTFDGANDIEFSRMNEMTQNRLQFYLDRYNWTFKALKIFRSDNKEHHKLYDAKGEPLELRLSKGGVATTLSRAFLYYALNTLNLAIVLKQLNSSPFGVDEHLWQSLVSTPELFPENGSIHLTRGQPITRFALWGGDPVKQCRSGNWRHAVCVFGLADLADHFLVNEYLFINKMIPDQDMEPIYCWHREMRMRNGN